MTQELRFIGKGDLVFVWGKFVGGFDWHFFGVPKTRWTPALGVSYYVATGDESDAQYDRLSKLVGG